MTSQPFTAPPDAPEENSTPATEVAPTPEQLPPNSIEGEQCVLGCILISPREAMDDASEIFEGGSKTFYDGRHQEIYTTLTEMRDNNLEIDVVTLQQKLKDKGKLEQIGGSDYLSKLSSLVPDTTNFKYYLKMVHEKWVCRRTVTEAIEIRQMAQSWNGTDIFELISAIENKILSLRGNKDDKADRTIREVMDGVLEKIEFCFANKENPQLLGIPSGLADIDKHTIGFRNGHMIVIAARPSMGKTSLAMQIAEHNAIDLNVPVGIISMEMKAEELFFRMACSRCELDTRCIERGQISNDDLLKLGKEIELIGKAPIYINDMPALNINRIRAKARRWKKKHDIKLLVIDYLQLAQSNTKNGEGREREIAQISNGCKEIARELDIPVIVLAQMNRSYEKDKSRPPMLSDLRESGAIEQDADVVGFLWKPEEAKNTNQVDLLFAKVRGGATGNIPLAFIKYLTRFRLLKKDQEKPEESKDAPPPPPPYDPETDNHDDEMPF